MAGGPDLATTAEQSLEIACRVARMDAGAVFRLDAEAGTLTMIAQRGASSGELARLRVRALDRGYLAEALRAGGMRVVDLATAEVMDPEAREALRLAGRRTLVILPIPAAEATWGAMALAAGEAREFAAPEVKLLEAVAAEVGLAVTRASLVAEARDKGRRLETLVRLARTLTATLALDEVLRRVVGAAVEMFGASQSGLWLLDRDAQGLWMEAAAGEGSARGRVYFAAGEGLVGIIVAQRAPLVVADLTRDRRLRNVERVRVEGLSSFAGVPITLGERVLGTLTIATRARRQFGQEEIELLQSLADHAAVAIDNARRFEEERTRRAQLASLLEITKRIGAAESTEALLRAIAEEAARLLDVDNAGFRLVEGDELVLAGLAGMATQTMLRPRIKRGESFSGRVVQEGRTIVADIGSMPELLPEHRAADERLGYTTFLGVPLRAGDRIIGAFTFRARRPFSARDQELAEAFADQAAVALEHARLFTLEQARRGQIEILAEIEREFAAELDLDRLLRLVVDRASRLFGANGVIYLVAGEGMLLPCAWSERADFDRQVPFGRGVTGTCAAERRGLLVNDYPASPYAVPEYVARGFRRMLAHPLVLRDRLLGVIRLSRTGPEAPAFAPDDLAVLESFATQAAIAIENARLHEEAGRRRREAEALAGLAQRLTETLEVSAVGERIVESVVSLLAVNSAGLRLLQPDGSLVAVAWGGRPGSRFAEGHVMPPATGLAALAIAEGRPMWSVDLLQDDRVRLDAETREAVTRYGLRAMLVVPLQAKGRTIGALILADDSARAFSPDEIALAQAFADQAALALENARLHEETEHRLRETETLLAVSRTLSSTLDFDRLSRQLMREIRQALGADSVGVWMADEGGQWLTPTIGYHVPAQWLPAIRGFRVSLIEHAFYAEAARTRRAVFSRDTAADARIPRFILEGAPHRSQLFVPIVAKERMIGGFIAVWWEQERDLAPRDLALMEAIAIQAGVALENLDLFEANLRQLEELSVLHELSRAVTGQLDRQALLEALRQRLPRVLAVDKFVVLLVDDKAGEVEVALRVQDRRVDTQSARRYPSTVGLASVVLQTGRPLRTTDYGAECARRGLALPDVDGPPCWLGVPLVAGNAVLGVLTLSRRGGPFSDAEERVAASIADLAALALRSARLYEERTRAYGELTAAQDHLVRTEKLRALGEMASGVAHDFNNLLAAILGRTQLLLRRIDDPRLRQWLQVIERSAMDGAQTVRRLQEFARVRRDEPLVPVDLNEIVRDALEMTQSRWRDESMRRGLTIDVQTRLGAAAPVAGDPAELREAMTNLILNAVDAMPSGGALTLTSAMVDGQVEVTVSDTGVGIPDGLREKIFDPFFTTKGPQGTGLGLSMTYGIVSRHGGRIAVTSEEGHGSTFRMTFPSLAAPTGPAAAAPAAAPWPGPLRCLVVDDEEVVGAVIGDVVESLGHQAVVVTDGAAAIERVRAEPFDAVFTDLAMPGVSGWQVAKAVKETAPAVPVFIVTGFGVALSADERRAHGVEAVYSKPLKIEDVMEAMAQVARRRARPDGREET